MPDYYTQFSEVLPCLTPEEEAWLRAQLQLIAVHGEDENEIDSYDDERAWDAEWSGPRFLRGDPDHDEMAGFEHEFGGDRSSGERGRHLWFHAEEYGNPDDVASLVQEFLKQFRPGECWSLTWAATCSRPVAGEFGGGAIFVTADEMKWQNVHSFVEEERAAFNARMTQAVGRPVPAEPSASDVPVDGNSPACGEPVNDKQRDAVADALGYEPGDDRIQEAVARHRGTATAELKEALGRKVA